MKRGKDMFALVMVHFVRLRSGEWTVQTIGKYPRCSKYIDFNADELRNEIQARYVAPLRRGSNR